MNVPLVIVCVGSVAACVGAAFGLQQVSPVPPVRDREILQTTSVTGKVAFLTKTAIEKEVEGLNAQQKLRKLFDLYVAEVLSLEDTLEFLFKEGKDTDVQDLYKEVMLRIYELEPEPPTEKQLTTEEEDELEYMKSFQKALEKAYTFLKPVERPEPVPKTEPVPTTEPVPKTEPPGQLGGGIGGRKRNITQKHRYPVVRTILYANS